MCTKEVLIVQGLSRQLYPDGHGKMASDGSGSGRLALPCSAHGLPFPGTQINNSERRTVLLGKFSLD
jgi:hypothetical protein